jgi:hypothetical protein
MAKKPHTKGKLQDEVKEIPPANHPSAEKRDLHPKDILLREYGYTIYSRPKDGKNLWLDIHGNIVTQEEANHYLRQRVK